MFGERLREIGFWALDFTKKSPVKSHYNDIKQINENKTPSNKKIEKSLSKLLKYVVNNSEYYTQGGV